jgi:ABC-type branched-subunit amino acid transport system ATPase component
MPAMVERVAEVTKALASSGYGVLLVEQNLLLGEAVCDQIHLMEKGRIVHSGTFGHCRRLKAAGPALRRRRLLARAVRRRECTVLGWG